MVSYTAYGDHLHDGKVQLSFSIPIGGNERKAREAAKILARKLGIHEVDVVHQEDLGADTSFFIVYGTVQATVSDDELAEAMHEETYRVLSKGEIEGHIAALGRPLTVIGACVGTDAHTVGIDAIMNVKGFSGEPGLEIYNGLKAINLGSQVLPEELIDQAIAHQADVVLVSQVITQQNFHTEKDCPSVALVGMAKNSGKTTAFNSLVAELSKRGWRLGVTSTGRD